MNSLSQQHAGQGITAVLSLNDTGERITIQFPPNARSSTGSLVLGSLVIEGVFKLVPHKHADTVRDLMLVFEPLESAAPTADADVKAALVPGPVRGHATPNKPEAYPEPHQPARIMAPPPTSLLAQEVSMPPTLRAALTEPAPSPVPVPVPAPAPVKAPTPAPPPAAVVAAPEPPASPLAGSKGKARK